MKRTVILAAVVLGPAGCQMPPGLLSDPRVDVRPNAGVAVGSPPLVNTTQDGFTRVSLELQNVSSRDVFVTCTTDWFDNSGHPMPGIMAAPTRLAVPVAGAAFCQTIAPNANAHLFRVAVAPSF